MLVRVLVAMKIFAGLAIGNAMALAQSFVVALERIGLNEPRPMCLNAELTLFARISRHDNLNWDIHHCSQHGVCDAGIARA